MPDRRPGRSLHTVLILLLFLLAPLHFTKLIPQFSTHILGDVMDAAEYPLNEWWTAYALLDLKTDPFRNTHQFHPLGLNMVQHTYNFLDGLLFTLCRPAVPLLVFHNALTWLSIFANSLAAYALLFSLTRLPGLSCSGALAFAHSPVLTSYIGVQSLIEPYLFVCFLLATHQLFKADNRRRAVGSGIVLGLSVYTYPYYFVAGLVWLGVLATQSLFPWALPAEPETTRCVRWGRRVPAVGGVLVLLSLLLLLPRATWDSPRFSGLLRTEYFLVFLLLLYLSRRICSWKSTPWPDGGDRSIYTRMMPATCRWAPPSGKEAGLVLRLSALLLLSAAVVAYPYTRSFVADAAIRTAIKSQPGDFVQYAVDLTGFLAPFHPWLASLARRISLDWNSDRAIVGTPAFLGYLWLFLSLLGVSCFWKRRELRPWVAGWLVFFFLCLGPYAKIHGVVHTALVLPAYFSSKLPLLESTRTSSRFLVPLVLLSITIGCLLLKESLRRTAGLQRALRYSGLVALVGFEFALWPRPYQVGQTNYQAPEVYHALATAARGSAGVLLELPLVSLSGSGSRGRGETRTLYYQSVHQQRLIGGVSSKLDDAVFTAFEKYPGIRAFWAMEPVAPGELAAALTTLGVNWIVLNKSRVPDEPLGAYLAAFREAAYLQRFYEDETYLGLRVDLRDGTLGESARMYRQRPAAGGDSR